jgi:hypothetical protein
VWAGNTGSVKFTSHTLHIHTRFPFTHASHPHTLHTHTRFTFTHASHSHTRHIHTRHSHTLHIHTRFTFTHASHSHASHSHTLHIHTRFTFTRFTFTHASHSHTLHIHTRFTFTHAHTRDNLFCGETHLARQHAFPRPIAYVTSNSAAYTRGFRIHTSRADTRATKADLEHTHTLVKGLRRCTSYLL